MLNKNKTKFLKVVLIFCLVLIMLISNVAAQDEFIMYDSSKRLTNPTPDNIELGIHVPTLGRELANIVLNVPTFGIPSIYERTIYYNTHPSSKSPWSVMLDATPIAGSIKAATETSGLERAGHCCSALGQGLLLGVGGYKTYAGKGSCLNPKSSYQYMALKNQLALQQAGLSREMAVGIVASKMRAGALTRPPITDPSRLLPEVSTFEQKYPALFRAARPKHIKDYIDKGYIYHPDSKNPLHFTTFRLPETWGEFFGTTEGHPSMMFIPEKLHNYLALSGKQRTMVIRIPTKSIRRMPIALEKVAPLGDLTGGGIEIIFPPGTRIPLKEGSYGLIQVFEDPEIYKCFEVFRKMRDDVYYD